MKKVIILGATGSIGRNALDVIRKNSDDFTVTGLSAHTGEAALLQAADEFKVTRALALSGKTPDSDRIAFIGKTALLRMIRETEADLVVNGIAGSEGLLPSVEALSSGKDLALANKETIVMAGPLIKDLASKNSKLILPVDSEHSAVFQLLRDKNLSEVTEIILTASGGPFRDKPLQEFNDITLADALKHPTWSMGQKISIDSATMANKGLEVIEAHELFNFPGSRIKVLIHPESRVHSLIRTADGEMYAQISNPDMRIPIQNALTFPKIKFSSFGHLDLADTIVSFFSADKEKFPLLFLAYTALDMGKSYKIAYNAANEAAVGAFIDGRIGFLSIHRIVAEVLEMNWSMEPRNFDEVLETDREVRSAADKKIKEHI